MSTLSTIILLSLLSTLCAFSVRQQPSENDNMCNVSGGILCVKDALMIIATIAKAIARTSIEIETNIKQTKAVQTLNRYINIEMNYTRLNYPLSQYHDEFFRRNNIDKEYLSQLFSEAHNALMYYYHSIDDLLKLQGVFAEVTDKRWKEIQDNIRYEMICRYRSVLDVYSQKWTSGNDIGRMQFSRLHRLSPSLIHDVHSIVLVQYVRKSMEKIADVIDNLEMKFF